MCLDAAVERLWGMLMLSSPLPRFFAAETAAVAAAVAAATEATGVGAPRTGGSRRVRGVSGAFWMGGRRRFDVASEVVKM